MKEEWFRTWFDTDYYHILYNHRDDKEAREFIDALLSFLKPSSDSTFLDVACGRGRHSLQLSERGYHTVGIDLSANSISFAKQQECERLHYSVRDIREPFECGTFNFALNLFTSFGYFDSTIEHLQALQNIRAALKPDGVFVLDFLNRTFESGVNDEKKVTVRGILFTTSKAIEGPHFTKNITVQDGEIRETYQEKVLAFSYDELIDLVSQAGFNILSVHGNYQMETFEQSHPRVIIIAQKK
jgi:SAM-dependent methyltransferase